MTAKKNAIAKDLRSPKYRPRVVKSKKAYLRRPKHPARAADVLSDQRNTERARREAAATSIKAVDFG